MGSLYLMEICSFCILYFFVELVVFREQLFLFFDEFAQNLIFLLHVFFVPFDLFGFLGECTLQFFQFLILIIEFKQLDLVFIYYLVFASL